MAVIKAPEDYSVTQLRKDVRDSLMLAGEECIVLQLFHAGDADATPCPECGDDIYESAEKKCTSCYGTMFNGGVRLATRSWALFTDHQVSEQLGPRGIYRPDARSFQTEGFPWLNEHDVVVRVRKWNPDHTPLELEGYYELGKVDRRSLRTGNRFGQYSWDTVGQKAPLSELSEKAENITNYPVLGKLFEESVTVQPNTPTGSFIVVQPDVKVIYFPFVPGPGGPVAEEPITGATGITITQTIPASTWTIQHTLGYEPNVSVIVGDEEVDAEVEYPNNSVVIINFGIPVAGTARLT